MLDTDDWFICNKCGKPFEHWGDDFNRTPGRCLRCASPALRRKYQARLKKRSCLLCGVEYDVPHGLGASTKYCIDHRGMDTHERKRAFAIRDGQPEPKRRYAQKVSVDNHIFVSVNNLFSNRSIEKIVKTLSDKRVVLVR